MCKSGGYIIPGMTVLSTSRASSTDSTGTQLTQQNSRWPMESKSVRLPTQMYFRPWKAFTARNNEKMSVLTVLDQRFWRMLLHEGSHFESTRVVIWILLEVWPTWCRECYGLSYSGDGSNNTISDGTTDVQNIKKNVPANAPPSSDRETQQSKYVHIRQVSKIVWPFPHP